MKGTPTFAWSAQYMLSWISHFDEGQNRHYFIMKESCWSGVAGVILLTCINALSYNIVHYMMIKHTSSVTTTVLGEMKIIAILVLSAFVLGKSSCLVPKQHELCRASPQHVHLYSGESKIWTLHMLMGCTTAILGKRTCNFCLRYAWSS